MKAKNFDQKFDAGDNLIEYLDLSKAKRKGVEQYRISIDFPLWMIKQLEKEASRLGVTRQAVIKIWLSERLERLSSSTPL